MALCVPVIVEAEVSVALMDREPSVLSVALKVCDPASASVKV